MLILDICFLSFPFNGFNTNDYSYYLSFALIKGMFDILTGVEGLILGV